MMAAPNYPVVIIAGGRGTRLGSSEIPKAMVDVAGMPLIEYQVRLAAAAGISTIYFLLGHSAQHIIVHIGDGSRFGIQAEYIVEEVALGTGGCVRALEQRINSPFFVLFGDLFIDFDLLRFERFFSENTGPCGMAVVAHPNSHPLDSDLLAVNSSFLVTEIKCRPHSSHEDFDNLVNAAIFLLRPNIFDYLPAKGPCDLVTDGLKDFLAAGGELRAYKTSEYIRDIGTKQRLDQVRREYVEGIPYRRNLNRRQRAIFLDRDGTLIRAIDHLAHEDQVELLDQAAKAVSTINGSDYLGIVTTNQPGIAKGFFDASALERIHRRLMTLLGRDGAYLDDLYYCPHHPQRGFDGEILELKRTCVCRKPAPGMLEAAAAKHNISLADSWMIGDTDIDVLTAIAAGCRAVRIGHGPSRFGESVVSSLNEGVELIVGNHSTMSHPSILDDGCYC